MLDMNIENGYIQGDVMNEIAIQENGVNAMMIIRVVIAQLLSFAGVLPV